MIDRHADRVHLFLHIRRLRRLGHRIAGDRIDSICRLIHRLRHFRENLLEITGYPFELIHSLADSSKHQLNR